MKAPQILFITSNYIGDAVLSTAVLGHLHKRFPRAEFTVVCGENPAPIFNLSYVRRVIPISKKRGGRHWWNIWQACVTTWWSMVVDMRSSALSFLVPTLHRHIWKALPDSQSKMEQFKTFLSRAFSDFTPQDLPLPQVVPSPECRSAAEAYILQYPRAVVLGTTANTRFKCWETEKYAQLAAYIHNHVYPDHPIVALGTKLDEPRLQALASATQGLVIPLAGCMDIGATAAFLSSATLFVGNDSGLMHLSAAVGTPTLGLFGPSPDHVYHPVGPRCHWVRTDRAYEDLMAEILPDWSNDPTFMATLSVEKVIIALHALLAQDPSSTAPPPNNSSSKSLDHP